MLLLLMQRTPVSQHL